MNKTVEAIAEKIANAPETVSMEDAKIVQRKTGTEKGSLGAQAMSNAQKNELQEDL